MPGVPPPAKCPGCGDPVPGGGKHLPFCSARCRSADLGRWFRGDYVVSRPLKPEDLPDEDGEPEPGVEGDAARE